MKPTRYDTLIEQVGVVKPQYIMEVGVWNGETARRMIREALRYKNPVEYFGFDLFEPAPVYEDSASKTPLSKEDIFAKLNSINDTIVHLFKGNTRETLPAEILNLPKMDLIWLDGGHSIETVTSDANYCIRLMHPKTVLFFDDYRNDLNLGCRPFVDALDRAVFNVTILEPVDVFKRSFGRLEVQIARVTLK